MKSMDIAQIVTVIIMVGVAIQIVMKVLSHLAFIFGTGWDKKARESIRKIELLASSLHARLPIFCPQTTNTPLYEGGPICFAAVAYGASLRAVSRSGKARELAAKLKAYQKLIRGIGPAESNIIDEIECAMLARSLSIPVLWELVGDPGYKEVTAITILISEWVVRKLCAGDVPSDISKACDMVQETILTASRLVVL